MVEEWRRRGHRVAVLTSRLRLPDVPSGAPDEPGVWRQLVLYRDQAASWRTRLRTERANVAALGAALRWVEPDVVSAWNLGKLSLSLLAVVALRDLPVVLVVCDHWLARAPQEDPWMRAFVGRPAFARFVATVSGLPTSVGDLGARGACCFVSAATRARTLSAPPWAPRRSGVVYSGVSLRDFPLTPSTPRPWRWRLLFVGRLCPAKGVQDAIAALAFLPRAATLEIAGRGDPATRHQLDELARRMGVAERVVFSAETERSRLAHRYRDADVVVFPSRWPEPFGLVPLEAMACGTPVVATGTGGSGEYLSHEGNSLLVRPADPPALATAVSRLAGDPGLRARLVREGLATAARLDVERLAAVLEEWHAAAAAGFPEGAPAPRLDSRSAHEAASTARRKRATSRST